jgi:hypothetical protein
MEVPMRDEAKQNTSLYRCECGDIVRFIPGRTALGHIHRDAEGRKTGEGRCVEFDDDMMTEAPSMVAVGQVWTRSADGSRVRIQGFSKIDGWIMVREIGGNRERGSYPPLAFCNGAFRLIDHA